MPVLGCIRGDTGRTRARTRRGSGGVPACSLRLHTLPHLVRRDRHTPGRATKTDPNNTLQFLISECLRSCLSLLYRDARTHHVATVSRIAPRFRRWQGVAAKPTGQRGGLLRYWCAESEHAQLLIGTPRQPNMADPLQFVTICLLLGRIFVAKPICFDSHLCFY